MLNTPKTKRRVWVFIFLSELNFHVEFLKTTTNDFLCVTYPKHFYWELTFYHKNAFMINSTFSWKASLRNRRDLLDWRKLTKRSCRKNTETRKIILFQDTMWSILNLREQTKNHVKSFRTITRVLTQLTFIWFWMQK